VRTVVFEREDGSEALITQYETGEVTLAERRKSWECWGAPITGVVEPPYDYVTARRTRRIEDLLLQAGTEGVL